MKKIILIILIFLLMISFMYTSDAVRVVTLPDLLQPRKIEVDENHLVIAETISVLVYSLTNFKVIKKFGKEGDGPGEFKGRITRLEVQPNCIFINSVGKVSYFTKDGTFIKEIKTFSPDLRLKFLGNGFIGERMVTENNTLYNSVDIYDAALKKITMVYRQEREVQVKGKGTKVFGHPLPYYFCDGKLFIVKGTDFVIDVLDKTGKKQYAITFRYPKIKVTSNDKKRVMNYLETDPEIKLYLELIKPIKFPDYFPAIRNYHVTDGNIYVLTYKEENGKSEWLVFDMKGSFIKKLLLPYKFKNPMDEYPAVIKNEKLYQLVENQDTEEWELHIIMIK